MDLAAVAPERETHTEKYFEFEFEKTRETFRDERHRHTDTVGSRETYSGGGRGGLNVFVEI